METKRLKLWQKIGYGSGDFGSNYCWAFVASFIMIYCTNALGVNAAAIGTIMLVSKLLDGVSDLFAGRIIDMTHSKMGKARFWYFVSAFPTALSVLLLFNVPASFSENTKYVYIFIVYTLMGAVFYTMSNISYSSLTTLVTTDPTERVQLGSFRFLFSIVATILITATTSGLVENFGGGQQGWRTVSIIYSIICLVFLLIPVFCVKELSPEELGEESKADNTGSAAEEKLGAKEVVSLLVRNKYFVTMLFAYLAFYLCSGVTNGMGIYYATYKLGDGDLLGTINIASFLPLALGLVLVPMLTSKMGMRKACLSFGIMSLAAMAVAYIAGLKGALGLFLAASAVKSLGQAPFVGSLMAFVAATDDYSELKFGHRLTGTIYSCSSVGIKIGTGIGTALCGFILEASKFDGAAAVQSMGTVSAISQSYLLFLLLQSVALVVVMWLMDVEETNNKLKTEKELLKA